MTKELVNAEHPVRELAIDICEQFCFLLDEHDMVIPNEERKDATEPGPIYGEDWYNLEDGTTEMLVSQFSKTENLLALIRETSEKANKRITIIIDNELYIYENGERVLSDVDNP